MEKGLEVERAEESGGAAASGRDVAAAVGCAAAAEACAWISRTLTACWEASAAAAKVPCCLSVPRPGRDPSLRRLHSRRRRCLRRRCPRRRGLPPIGSSGGRDEPTPVRWVRRPPRWCEVWQGAGLGRALTGRLWHGEEKESVALCVLGERQTVES